MQTKTINKMIEYFKNDVQRINHALKVYSFASLIAHNEKLSDSLIEIIEIASVLHDIGIPLAEKKYNSSAGKYQEIEGPAVAREILEKLEFDEQKIKRICFLIGNHHSYSKIDHTDFQILVEADFLVNIYEGKIDEKSRQSIRNKYIRTKSGQQIFDSIYRET